MKKLLLVVLFPLLLLAAGFFLCAKKPPFGPGNFLSYLKPQAEWEIPALANEQKQELDALLAQPYAFLAAGAQNYAFLARDGKTVVKFFRRKSLQPKPWSKKEKAKLTQIFSACKIAYTDLKEESGLIFLQLNPGEAFKMPLTIYDRTGKSHTVDLNKTSFLVQKRADLLYDHLSVCPNQKEAVCHFFRLILARCQKGIADGDQGIRNNFGFSNNTPIQIDIGRLYRDRTISEPDSAHRELARILTKLKDWAIEHNPSLIPIADTAFQECLKSIWPD